MIYKQVKAKSLGNSDECKKRFDKLSEPHILPLTTFVNKIREKHCPWHVPYFDPCDGGINAKCLFVLESPGPNAVISGFISRDNPDKTAEKFLKLNDDVVLQRTETAIWNIVPWYLGKGQKISHENRQDGLKYLKELISLLRELKIVVLFGKDARSVKKDIDNLHKGLKILECPHPSPQSLNTDKRKTREREILKTLQECLKDYLSIE